MDSLYYQFGISIHPQVPLNFLFLCQSWALCFGTFKPLRLQLLRFRNAFQIKKQKKKQQQTSNLFSITFSLSELALPLVEINPANTLIWDIWGAWHPLAHGRRRVRHDLAAKPPPTSWTMKQYISVVWWGK